MNASLTQPWLSTILVCLLPVALFGQTVAVWRSSEDGRLQLTADRDLSFTPDPGRAGGEEPVVVDPAVAFQSMLGFGASFEHASCYNLSRLEAAWRERTIERLVDPVSGIGMNLMRVCIGTSDFVGEPWYTYNDLPAGETDFELERFSIERDRAYVLPVLELARRKNPDLLFYASPWSPPAWMKEGGSLLGGRLKRDCYGVYARYLLRFVRAYAAEGVPIHALTPQNEPQYPNPRYPTCLWSAEDQRRFIRDHLGPLFEREGVETRIWCWDHNWNRLDFPRAILSDPEAARFVDGTAFHHYEGEVQAQGRFHDEFPEKPIYFTEGSTFGTRGAVQIVQILRHQARSYNAWVILLDEHRQPNNGPHPASATPIELLDDLTLRTNFDYFMYGQFMRFVPRGAVRIHSTIPRPSPNVAFRDPKGGIVLVAVNPAGRPAPVTVICQGARFADTLPPKSVATYRWPATAP